MSESSPVPPNLIFLVTISRSPIKVRLGPLEQRVLRLVSLRCSDAQIAAILGRGKSAIRACRRRVNRRLGVADWADSVAWAVRQGLSYEGDRLSPSEQWALGWPGP